MPAAEQHAAAADAADVARPVGRVLVLHPDLQRAGEPAAASSRRVRAAVPAADVLVLDDNSPDGTGEVADALAAADAAGARAAPRRQGGPGRRLPRRLRLGPGRAATTPSSRWTPTARTSPSSCPRCWPPSTDADLVIGSRWVRGGAVRQLAAAPQGALASAATSTPGCCSACRSHDATGGYRAYRADALRTMGLDDVASQGYCFQVDLTWRAVRPGCACVEVPITFVEREIGDSKMSGDIVRESLRRITALGRGAPRRPAARCWPGTGSRRGTGCRSRAARTPDGAAVRAGWPWSSCCCSSSRSSRSPPSSRSGKVIGGWQTLSCWSLRVAARRLAGPARGRPRLGRAAGRRCNTGRMPSRQLADAALVLVGRHAAARARASSPTSSGFFFVLPFTRPLARRLLEAVVARRLLGRHVSARSGAAGGPGPRRRGPRRHRGRGPLTSPDAAAAAIARTAGSRTRHPGRRRPRPARGLRSRVDGSGGALAARLLAAGLAQEGQALLEELLELGDGATLEQHVPVGAHVLDRLGLGLGAVARAWPPAPQRHSHVGGTSASTENGSSMRVPLGADVAS